MNCTNCFRPLSEHCKIHTIPCCPGKCPGNVNNVAIVCSHLLRTPEMPCVLRINDPIHEQDSGKVYVCEACDKRAAKLTPNDIHTICESHCDAMTIIETLNQTEAHTMAAKNTKEA